MKKGFINGKVLFIINLFLTVVGVYISFKILKGKFLAPIIIIIIIIASYILGDIICRLSLIFSKKRNDYRVFTGITGKEDKNLVRIQLERAIIANSLAVAVGIITVILPIYINKYSVMNLFLSIGLYLAFFFEGLFFSRRNIRHSNN